MPDLGDDMNKACIRGTVRRPAGGIEATLHSGAAVVRLTVESVQTFTRNGEQCRASEFHKVVVFDPACRQAAAWARMGERVYVEGHIQTRKYMRGGTRRGDPASEARTTEIVLNPGEGQFMRLGPSPDQENDDNGE